VEQTRIPDKIKEFGSNVLSIALEKPIKGISSIIEEKGTVKLIIYGRKESLFLNFRQQEVFEQLHPRLI